MAELTSRFKTDFEEIELLGQGADGRVVLCKDRLDQQKYVVKQKLFDPTKEKEKAECFREAQILALMDHANVLRYYTCWIENSPAYEEKGTEVSGSKAKSAKKWTLFIVTEYCDSHLGKLLEAGPISDPDKALNVFAQTVEGLKHIQEKTVMHCDLKPDNIFLKNGQVKIANFSLAKFLEVDALTSYCTPGIGTEPYIAPEMKKGTVSMKSDIYSLGFLFYELLNDFGTGSERATELDKLRSKKTHSKFWVKERSGLTKLLMKMICDDEDRLDVVNLYSRIQQLQERRRAGELIWHAS